MTGVLMLAPRMQLGYGVSEAVAMQVRGLRQRGMQAYVGCTWHDDAYADVGAITVAADKGAIADLAHALGVTTIIAHGTPYFEVLPSLADFHTVAYEYGDPTPELFDHDAAQRRMIADAKRTRVYPHVAMVATISEFIRHDIEWPDATVIYLGVDHVPDLGPKPRVTRDDGQPLRIGCLMRMGAGEARYKGHDEFLELATLLDPQEVRLSLIGRGTEADSAAFRDAGIDVRLNVTDAERAEFLRSIDVFVSLSLWEGMNLPLVEAQALGTPGLALDTGAHPEFTPLLFDSLGSMAAQLHVYATDPGLLARHGELAHSFVRRNYPWARTVDRLEELVLAQPDVRPRGKRRGFVGRQWGRVERFARGLRDGGVRKTIEYHLSRLR